MLGMSVQVYFVGKGFKFGINNKAEKGDRLKPIPGVEHHDTKSI